jgi:lipopolysaccharide export system protein LptA
VRWQKVVRLIVAAIGLGTAVAIYLLARPKPAPPPPRATITIDANAKVQTGAGKTIRTDGDRIIGTQTFAATRTYDGGRIQADDFRYDFADGGFMSDEHVEAQGTSASNSALPEEFRAVGTVVFRNRSGMELHGDEVVFNDASGIAIIKGPVTFSRGRTSGSGTDAVYEQKTGRFTLQQNTHVIFAPADPAAAPIDITSQSMLYANEGKTMAFDGNARIARPTETLVSNHTTLYFADDEKNFKTIELRENSQVTPIPGKSSDLPDMRAQDIDLNFFPNSSLLQNASLNQQATMVLTNESGRRSVEGNVVTFAMAADGKTLTRLDARDRAIVKTPRSGTTPERKISANTLVASATSGQEAKGLSAARFDGNVEFVELVPGGNGKADTQRVGTSQVLTAKILGQLDAIDEARFEQNVKFNDGDISGNADVGIYRAAKAELELQPLARNPRFTPHVSDGSVTVDAKEVVIVNLDTNDIVARRDVSTVSVGRSNGPAGKPDRSAIFNSTDKLYGSGAAFWYAAGGREARYQGTAAAPARLTQGQDSVVSADEITFSDESQNLTAKGRVSTSFLMSGSGDAAPKQHRATADTMQYVDATRTATYVGDPAVLTSADGETRAKKLVLELAAESKSLRQMTGTTNVRMTLVEGRLAESESLLYDAVKDVYILQGKPLSLFTRDSDGRCTVQTASYTKFDGAVGAPESPGPQNPDGTASNSGQACPPGMPPARPAAPAKK